MTVRVKICGITRKEDLLAAAASGADALGFVVGVPNSPRNISLETAAKLIKQVPGYLLSVLVTVPASLSDLKTYARMNPDALQIHGEALPYGNVIREILPNTFLIRAVNAKPNQKLNDACRASKMFDAVLVDSYSEGKQGGTGTIHDWALSKRVKQMIYPKPLILAGGLTPENVREAVRTVEPFAVDVSSGVEQHPGIKNHEKMTRFIKNAKDARK